MVNSRYDQPTYIMTTGTKSADECTAMH